MSRWSPNHLDPFHPASLWIPFFWFVCLLLHFLSPALIVIGQKTNLTSPAFPQNSQQQKRNGKDAIFSSKDALDSWRGPTEALGSAQARHSLWHIWVMCFTLGLLGLCAKHVIHTQSNMNSPLRKGMRAFRIHTTLVAMWASDWF